MMTNATVEKLKKLSDGWGGETHKKPASKAVRKLKRVLTIIEEARMPFPIVHPVANGGILLIWKSLTRDMMMTVDPDGDVVYVTSLKHLDPDNIEVIERLDSEGHVIDMKTIDHMMAWYCFDQAHAA